MKIAVSGKGGVGKTTVAAYLARLLAKDNHNVLAVDADPSPSLASALGLSEYERGKLIPITQMADLIEERTGLPPSSKTGSADSSVTSFGKLFTMNPKVDDIADRFAVTCEDNVKLLLLGTIDTAGRGCFCPENALLKSLLRHLILTEGDFIILDMEAGTEHLGRGTARGLDLLLIVVEPGKRSLETASRIKKLAEELDITRIGLVVNKVPPETDMKDLEAQLSAVDLPVLATIPFNLQLIDADLHDRSPFDYQNTEDISSIMIDLKDKVLNIKSENNTDTS
jgi:CO dehydrogenase maturation factor